MRRLLFLSMMLVALTSCSVSPITADYGVYPNNYEDISRKFYQEQNDKIDYIFSYAPKQYHQKSNEYGFSIPYKPKLWLNTSMGDGIDVKGYLVCNIERSFDDGYKTDALLIYNGKVLSVVHNVRRANINGMKYKLCMEEDNQLLGMLEKISREKNIQYIDNFIEKLKR